VRRVTCAVALFIAWPATASAAELSPCEAYGAAVAVFVGEAGAPVRRLVAQTDGPPVWETVSPVTVERSFRGVSSPIVFVTPLGIDQLLVPGERYLVYGHSYSVSDTFMASDGIYGTKPLARAGRDLEFLDLIAPNASGGTISGVLEFDASNVSHIGTDVAPLANIAIRASNGERAFETRTASTGWFQVSGLPRGTYTIETELPPDLAMSKIPWPMVELEEGGCVSMSPRVVPNGQITGRLRFPARPAGFASVSLIPFDRWRPGTQEAYVDRVEADRDGRFSFEGVRPGRYVLGHAATYDGGPMQRAYYPGTEDATMASVIEIGPATIVDVGEFLIPDRAQDRD
jgi:hypothetical protein